MDLIKGEKTQVLLRITAYVSLFIIVVTTSYGIIASIVQGVEVVGQTFVEVEFPPIHVFPFFYMKPISWLFAAIVLFFYSALELHKDRIARISKFPRSLIRIIAFVVATLAFYEVLFNFTLWSGLMASDAVLGKLNPDVIINPFPNPEIPWNIVFATKLYLSATIVSAYSFYFFSKTDREVKPSQ